MERYLVTGASGFVGGEVLRQLRELNVEITAVDFRDPHVDGVKFVNVDITNQAALESALEDYKFDYILHIASLPGDTGDSRQMVDVNVCGCVDILELGRKKNVKRVVVVSSISAYEWYPATKFNPPDYMPVDEAHPLRPKDMYSSTKQMQEILTTTYYHEYQLPACAIRLAAVVGPNGQGGGRGWRETAEQLAGGVKVQIPHFSMEERCHYADIRDVARMLIHCATHDSSNGHIFNCCGPHSVTGAEFAAIIHKYYPQIAVETGFPWSMAQGGEIEFSMKKAKEIMGYEPIYALDDSIRYIKEWIDNGGLSQNADRVEKYGEGVKE